MISQKLPLQLQLLEPSSVSISLRVLLRLFNVLGIVQISHSEQHTSNSKEVFYIPGFYTALCSP